jgi:CBS domain-containing protein
MRPRAEEPVTRRMAVRDVMNPDVIAVRDDMTLQEAAAFLVENQISGAPVEDAEGRLIGVVSYADIARATSELSRLDAPPSEPEIQTGSIGFFGRSWEDLPETEVLPDPPSGLLGLTVREIMTPDLYSVPQDAPVGAAARLMLDAHIHRVLVTNGHSVVGILTTYDLLSLLLEES